MAGGRSLAGDPLLRLVDRIYQGAVDAQAWPGIVEEICGYLASPQARLFTPFVPPADGGLHISIGLSEAAVQEWASRYIQHDVWAQAGMARDLFHDGVAVIDVDLVPEREFLESLIHTEYLSKIGVARLCSGVIFGGKTPGLPATLFSTYRSSTHLAFGDAESSALKSLIPHLSRSLGVMYRLRDAELKAVASLAALDRLAMGVVLLDAKGGVAHVNREAQRMLDANDGLDLGAPAMQSPLASVLRDDLVEVPHFSTAVQLVRPSGRRPYLLQVAPLPESNRFSREAGLVSAIVFVTEPDRAIALDPALMSRLYSATAAETRLAGHLCAGDTLVAAAEHCGISENTARSQLQRLFEKTGTHRQADLVRLLAGLASGKA